jgi:hypothetical protein
MRTRRFLRYTRRAIAPLGVLFPSRVPPIALQQYRRAPSRRDAARDLRCRAPRRPAARRSTRATVTYVRQSLRTAAR